MVRENPFITSLLTANADQAPSSEAITDNVNGHSMTRGGRYRLTFTGSQQGIVYGYVGPETIQNNGVIQTIRVKRFLRGDTMSLGEMTITASSITSVQVATDLRSN